MNIIKKSLFIIIFLVFSTITGNATTYEYDDITIGETSGKICQYGASGPYSKQAEESIFSHLQKCEDEKRNPFDWQHDAPQGVNIVFRVSGDLDKIHRLASTPNGRSTCWIWANCSKITDVRINLKEDGFGWVDLFEDSKWVGTTTCRSSTREKQPKDGVCNLGAKCMERKNEEFGYNSKKFKRWMAWAVPLENKVEGIFLHAGSFDPKSTPHGCVRLPHPYAKIIHTLSSDKTVAEIRYVVE